MQLVVEKLALILTALDRLELSAAGSIPHCILRCSEKNQRSSSRDLDSGLNHDLIDDLGICLHFEVSNLVDADEAGE